MPKRKKADENTEYHLFGRRLNKAAKASRDEGAGVPGIEHAHDHKYYYAGPRKGWILKPQYDPKKKR